MKSSIITLLFAAASVAVAQPTTGKDHDHTFPSSSPAIISSNTIKEPTTNLSKDPAFIAAYNDVVNRVPKSIEKRACGGLDPCCDTSTGCDSRDPCYANCASIPGTGSLGCVAGASLLLK